jgi:protein-S-isoprenylcysteine O-methyltransferase Ste14
MSLVLRSALFTLIVPGAGGVYAPWWILTRGGSTPEPVAFPASVLIVSGAVLYVGSVWMFAVVGRGTPGLWDAPRRVVAAGPSRWVRNPIYISALLIVVGEAWLFMSLPLFLYAGALAAGFHVLVVGYEEPSLRDRFGDEYDEYRRHVSRWIPRPPGHAQGAVHGRT